MNDPARTIRALRGLSEAPRRYRGIVARLRFDPNSYSYSAMKACMAVGRALEVVEALEDSLSGREGC